jgi:hypothetical protein
MAWQPLLGLSEFTLKKVGQMYSTDKATKHCKNDFT